jgi:hypothetical protein
MKIYYAHSVALYDTPQETRDIELLEALGFSVLNPNQLIHSVGYQHAGMSYFESLLDLCGGLAFRGNPGGSVNAGIMYEIDYMQKSEKPIFELPSWVGRHQLSVGETRYLLSELGHR